MRQACEACAQLQHTSRVHRSRICADHKSLTMKTYLHLYNQLIRFQIVHWAFAATFWLNKRDLVTQCAVCLVGAIFLLLGVELERPAGRSLARRRAPAHYLCACALKYLLSLHVDEKEEGLIT